jgi:rhomboid protease GluP
MIENQDPTEQNPSDEASEPATSVQDLIIFARIQYADSKVTYGIIAINVFIFVLMALSGVGIFEPYNKDLIDWGAMSNIPPYDVQKWRLFTSMFVHIGLFHILLNMYALYQLNILEKIIGYRFFLIAYLISGLGGNVVRVVSSFYYTAPTIGAGTSGTLFGMFGVFVGLLLTDLIPKIIRDRLLKIIGIFTVLNLMCGMVMQGSIDNAAHIGGLLTGVVIGFLIYRPVKKEIDALANQQP